MSDLTEFLLARIAEDEQRARGVVGDMDGGAIYVEYAVLDASERRVLAECEAKRRIVARHHDTRFEDDGSVSKYSQAGYCEGCLANFVEEYRYHVDECPEKRDLAAIYVDHADYDPTWRPD